MGKFDRKIIDKLNDNELAELLLDKKQRAKRRTKSIVAAFMLWAIFFIISFYIIDANKVIVAERVLGISFLGFLLIACANCFTSYKGPVWPIAGRPFLRIDKPTPQEALLFLGLILLLLPIPFLIALL